MCGLSRGLETIAEVFARCRNEELDSTPRIIDITRISAFAWSTSVGELERVAALTHNGNRKPVRPFPAALRPYAHHHTQSSAARLE